MNAQPSQEVARRTPAQELVARIRGSEFKQQVALALPEGVHPDRFVRVMATALLDDPDLAAKADPASIFQAGLKAAQDGLFPDGREAAFVVYGNKAVYMPMIGGYRKIAAEHGWSIRTAVVYENDDFEQEEGLQPRLVHRPVRPGMPRGKLIAAYAIGSHRDGRTEPPVVLYQDDIDKIKRASRASGRGPWVDWEDRMWEKSAGRRLFAKLPLDPADVRVRGLLEHDPVTAVYGPRASLSAPGASASTEPPDASGVSPQAEGPDSDAADAATDGSGSSAAPVTGEEDIPFGDVEEGEIVDEQQTALVVEPPEVVEAAGRMELPGGQHKGKTVAQVFAYDPEYLRSGAVKRLQGADAALAQAVDIYLAAQNA